MPPFVQERRGPRRFKPLLRRIDHSTIFVFIAAGYTPVALIVMHGPVAWGCSPPPPTTSR